jgi:SAM-dependent methyltransferase
MSPNMSYLPNRTLDEYLDEIARRYPDIHVAIDFGRSDSVKALHALAMASNEFDSDETGRGDSYREAQKSRLVRWSGISTLLGLAVPTDAESAPPLVLDVLGGDALIAKAATESADARFKNVNILTGDLSGPMVNQALADGWPAIRQAAEHLFIRDDALDGVLIAYGTHHIGQASRRRAVLEAVRAARIGGHVVVHDFDEDSPMAGFFTDVVHPNTSAGHSYDHFSRQSMLSLFDDTPTIVQVGHMYDPFVTRAGTPTAAKKLMCEYVGSMYGVRHVIGGSGDVEDSWSALTRYFDHSEHMDEYVGLDAPVKPVVYRQGSQYIAEVPRIALVATARKTGT